MADITEKFAKIAAALFDKGPDLLSQLRGNSNIAYSPKGGLVPGLTPGTLALTGDSYAGAVVSAGRQVYLSGVPGLPAGVYTLLPGTYGELPGAFLVSLQSSPSASTSGGASTTTGPLLKSRYVQK